MDYAACNIVYVDRTAGEDRLVKREEIHQLDGHVQSTTTGGDGVSGGLSSHVSDPRVHADLSTLLGTFCEVHVCSTGKSCVRKLSELHEASMIDLIPTLVLIDIPYNDSWLDHRAARTPSPTSSRKLEDETIDSDETDSRFYGLSLLQWIVSDIQQHNLSKLIVPVAVVAMPKGAGQWPLGESADTAPTQLDHKRTMRYLDVGAVDVLTSPLILERSPSLTIHAYRAHKEAMKENKALMELKRGRKRSWVGLDDQKPYAYLREAMVSGLMDGICRLGGEEEPLLHSSISVTEERKAAIVAGVGSWYFSAHDFTDDELLFAAVLMLQHALSMPELEQWRMPAGLYPTFLLGATIVRNSLSELEPKTTATSDLSPIYRPSGLVEAANAMVLRLMAIVEQYLNKNLTGFLMACRAAYNSFVPYHNFRHVVDVLQACFHFLTRIGTLPPFPVGSERPGSETAKSPIAALLRPFDGLTLLITAIGHDVGHPGVNNAFLVTLNAPLAQLYNDRSVLESFHCAAYSQILRRHWPAAFSGVEMRQLMISSILATDMGLHFDYMKKLGFLEEKLHENKGTDGWNGRTKEEYRTLACSLLIKCADISNVARRYDVAAKWTMILTDEFARQASMERDLAIPSALFAPPVREIVELGQSQVGFMNMFAIPLFQGVTDVMPAMKFCVDELQRNCKVWEDRIEMEQAKKRKNSDDSGNRDGTFSPRHMSLAAPVGKRAGSSPVDGATNSSRSPPFGNSSNSQKNHNSKSPLSSPDSTFSAFRSLVDIPASEDSPNASHLSSENLIPPQYSLVRQTSKPTPASLELSYATASAPGLLDHPAQNGNVKVNANSLVTEAVVPEPQIAKAATEPILGTDENQSATSTIAPSGTRVERGEWTGSGSGSQATSATTGKLPLSPSTNGTSVMSDDNEDIDPLASTTNTVTSASKSDYPGVPAPPSTADSSAPASRSGTSATGAKSWPNLPDQTSLPVRGRNPNRGIENEKSGGIVGTMKGLAKRPSRSRFKFWKKKSSFSSSDNSGMCSKDDIPPLPSNGEGR